MVNVSVFHICQTRETLNTSALTSIIHVELDKRMEKMFRSCDTMCHPLKLGNLLK